MGALSGSGGRRTELDPSAKWRRPACRVRDSRYSRFHCDHPRHNVLLCVPRVNRLLEVLPVDRSSRVGWRLDGQVQDWLGGMVLSPEAARTCNLEQPLLLKSLRDRRILSCKTRGRDFVVIAHWFQITRAPRTTTKGKLMPRTLRPSMLGIVARAPPLACRVGTGSGPSEGQLRAATSPWPPAPSSVPPSRPSELRLGVRTR
jgi:hypothetical protein